MAKRKDISIIVDAAKEHDAREKEATARELAEAKYDLTVRLLDFLNACPFYKWRAFEKRINRIIGVLVLGLFVGCATTKPAVATTAIGNTNVLHLGIFTASDGKTYYVQCLEGDTNCVRFVPALPSGTFPSHRGAPIPPQIPKTIMPPTPPAK